MNPSDPDLDLIQKAQGGDQKAMTALYVRYRRRLLNYHYRLLGNRSLAEELAQETFLRVVQNLHRFQPIGSVGGWIYKIANHLSLNALRSRAGHGELSLNEPAFLTEEDSMERQELIPHPGLSPAQEVMQDEWEATIQEALLRIPPVYRQVLILCDIEGYPYKEAAEVLSCSINTVASRLARGRARLGELLRFLRREF